MKNEKTYKKIFVTSDSHYYHSNMIKWESMPRRFIFNTVEEMNERLISNWNSVVSDDDLVYHLGDFAFASHKRTREILERLNGDIHLLAGNHDRWKDINKLSDCFIKIDNYKEIKHSYNGETYHIIMMHYPLQQWNRSHYNSIMLCGHSHSMLEHDVRVGHIKYDVGVDTDLANFYPVLLDDIILDAKKMVPNF